MNRMNMAQPVERGAALFPERTAIFFEDIALSYLQLNTANNRLANSLAELGIRRGDCVALLLPNNVAFIITYLGLQKLGAIVVTINPALKPKEVEFILNDSRSKLLVTTASLHESLASEALSALSAIVLTDGGDSNALFFDELLSQASAECASLETTQNDPAVLIYTSGTTGFPKGALLSQGTMVVSARMAIATFGIMPTDRILTCLSLCHSFTQTGVLMPCFEAGATLILLRQFEAWLVLCKIKEHAATVFGGVPMIYNVLSEQATPEQLQSVRLFISGGAPLAGSMVRNWHEKYQRVINECYGLTETCLGSLNQDPLAKPDSIGRPLTGIQFRILDSAGESARPTEIGEIAIHSASAMLGYWDREAETAAVFRDGWFYTGDIGCMDSDGYYYIVDRGKDMINVGGLKVYPSEVENVLRQHPSVSEAVVYGIPEVLLGEQVLAAIVLKPDQTVSQKELLDLCVRQLASFKVPSRIDFVASIPKSPSGKILKRVLRDQQKTLPAQPATSSAPLRHILAALPISTRNECLMGHVREVTTELLGATLVDDAPFAAFGMDSLRSIQLANRLSTLLGINLAPTLAFRYGTTAKLANFLAETLNSEGATGAEANPVDNAPPHTEPGVASTDWYPQLYNQRECFVWYEEVANKIFLHVHLSVYIRSLLNVPCLEQALNLLVERHEILRTVYARRGTELLQRTLDKQSADFVVINLADQGTNQSWFSEVDRISAVVQQPFDLGCEPVMRVRLFSKAADDHLLVFVHHHIAFDATAFSVFINELWSIYAALQEGRAPQLPPITTTWKDFVRWQTETLQGAEGERLWQFWQTQIPRKPLRLNVPTDYPRPARDSHHGWLHTLEIDQTVTQQLRHLAQSEGSTLYGVLMTAFHILLHCYTHQDEIRIASHVANRNSATFANVAGYLADTLPICVRITKDLTFKTLLQEVQATLLAALEHQGFPLRLLAERLGIQEDATQTAICQAWFTLLPLRVFQESKCLFELDAAQVQFGPLTLEAAELIPAHHGAWYDLDMVLSEGEQSIFGTFVCKSELFSEDTAIKIIADFQRLLRMIIANPTLPVQINLLSL